MTAPPSSAKAQVARLLTLVPYLHARGTVRLEQAAADLGVSPDQLVRDLKVLFMCGLPGGYPDDLIDVALDALEGQEGEAVIRVSNADYLSRPLHLSPTEATAVIVALRALRNGATDATREIVDAVANVATGGTILDARSTRALADLLRGCHRGGQRVGFRLTRRERDILVSIDRGDSVKQTARALGIATKTVENLQTRLFRKLGARNRAQAVGRAHSLGLLDAAAARRSATIEPPQEVASRPLS